MSPLLIATAVVQGLYYLATGLWPLLSLQTFMRVTGPKTDGWLVRTVGLLVGVSGLALLLAAWSHRVTPEMILLGIGQAVALATIDVVYAVRGRISKIYLLDAVAEAVLVAGWVAGSL